MSLLEKRKELRTKPSIDIEFERREGGKAIDEKIIGTRYKWACDASLKKRVYGECGEYKESKQRR